MRLEAYLTSTRLPIKCASFVVLAADTSAGIAQLVEHLLAKQKVASSNLVSRSKFTIVGRRVDRRR